MSKKTRRPRRTFNKHAAVRTRTTRNGKLRTETVNREDCFSVAVSTSPRTQSTSLFIDTYCNGQIKLDGRQTRTLFRALCKHYAEADKNPPEVVGITTIR